MASKAPVKYISKFDRSKTSKIKVKLKDEDNKDVKEHIPIFNGGDIEGLFKTVDEVLKLAMCYKFPRKKIYCVPGLNWSEPSHMTIFL